MTDIFVTYRRDESRWSAGRINDRLVRHPIITVGFRVARSLTAEELHTMPNAVKA